MSSRFNALQEKNLELTNSGSLGNEEKDFWYGFHSLIHGTPALPTPSPWGEGEVSSVVVSRCARTRRRAAEYILLVPQPLEFASLRAYSRFPFYELTRRLDETILIVYGVSASVRDNDQVERWIRENRSS